jgi:hypothetical protein
MDDVIFYVRQYERDAQGKISSEETVTNKYMRECSYASYMDAVNDILTRVAKNQIAAIIYLNRFDDKFEDKAKAESKYKVIHENNLIHLFYRREGWDEIHPNITASDVFKHIKRWKNIAHWDIHMLQLPPIIMNKIKLLG